MATTFTNNGNGTHTLQITYTADSTKLTNVLDDAAHWFFDHGFAQFGGPGNYAAQTLANKRAILDAAIKQTIVDVAKDQHINDAVNEERELATAEANANWVI